MYIQLFLAGLAMTTTFTMTACSSGSDDPRPTESQLNPNAEQMVDDGQGGDDTTAIAGLWDGSVTEGEITDVIYWSLTENGVLTRYDYQQDGAMDATDENCYITGDPISVSAEGDDSYSFFNVAATAIVTDDILTITFIDADINDLDDDDDRDEIPTFVWPRLTTVVLEDLNVCTEEEPDQTDSTDASGSSEDSEPNVVTDTDTTDTDTNTDTDTDTDTDTNTETDADSGENDPANSGEDPVIADNGDADIPFDNTDAQRPLITRAQCLSEGGSIIGDIGNGAIHQPEYRCESGEPPIARITYLEGEPIAAEGEVCCL